MKTYIKVIAILALSVLLYVDLPAQIQNHVQIHGFGGWAAGRTDNDNQYGLIASKQTPMANYYFTLNLSAQLERNVSIFVQPSWQTDLSGDQVVLDYAFAQWTLAKQFGLRVGKIKNPLGSYAEILNVGTLRPFYLIPQSTYFSTSQSYSGVGLTGIIGLGSLELSYDLFGGRQSYFPISFEMPVAVDPVTSRPIYLTVPVTPEGRNLVAGRLLLQTPISGFKIGGIIATLDLYYQIADMPIMRIDNKRSVGYTGQAEYVTDRIHLRAEYGEMDDPNLSIIRGFGEAAFKITPHWQVAADYDWAEFKWGAITMVAVPKDPDLSKHHTAGLALNYWISPDLVFKLNRYWVKGNVFCKPESAAQSLALGTLKHTTDVWIFGMQFAF